MFESHRLEEIKMDATSQSTATRGRELVWYDPAPQDGHQRQDEQFKKLRTIGRIALASRMKKQARFYEVSGSSTDI